MPIEFNCDQCGTLLRIADEHAGKKGRCPTCQSLFDIPGGVPKGSDSEFDDFHIDERTQDYTKPAPKPDYTIDDNPYATPRPTGFTGIRPVRYSQPHRGTQILVFAILGMVCCFPFGIIAWVMANEDLRKMRSGVMDPSGLGITQAGRVIGIISLVLIGISVVIDVFFGALGAL
jgi:hypothetical protein